MIPEVKKILYATDLSKNAGHAFRYAVAFSKKFNAEIIILHVIEEMSADARLVLMDYLDTEFSKKKHRQDISDRIEQIKSRVQAFCDKEIQDKSECSSQVSSIEVCTGYPEEQILKKVNELDCDVIIMGTHEKGRSHTFLGSVAKRVLRRARKPVFIIPLPKGKTDITFNDS